MATRITVDLGEWEVDGWDAALDDAVEVDISGGGESGEITIRLKRGADFDTTVRKIGKEMIEAFFNTESLYVVLEADGVRLDCEQFAVQSGLPNRLVIPWEQHVRKAQAPFICIGDRVLFQELVKLCRNECAGRGIPWPPPDEITPEMWEGRYDG
jgi:hypothetical protein